MTSPHFSRSETERTVATARLVLALVAVYVVWLDSEAGKRFTGATLTLHTVYLLYAITLAALVWNRPTSSGLQITTHVVDIEAFSIFQYLTSGPPNPFLLYFMFSLFCGSLRWQWRGTLGTALLILPSYLVIGLSMERALGSGAFELRVFLIRLVYLAATAAMLVYLGRHETRRRSEIRRLARWPGVAGPDPEAALARVLNHAGEIVGARYLVVAWEAAEEPWLRLACHSPTGVTVSKHRPGEIDPVVPPPLAEATIRSRGRLSNSSVSLITRGDTASEWHGLPLHAGLLPSLGGVGLTSAPFRTEQISGRVFFTDLADPTPELLSLTEVVARDIGTSIDQLHATEQLKELAANEQRIRLGRDLHDGVLQSLTGIRFQLATVAATFDHESPDATRDRLTGLERAVAIEQRELRLFIDTLKPIVSVTDDYGGLAARLRALRERLELEWKTPITLATPPQSLALSEEVEHAILFIAQEAVTNALKHAHPSRVSVDVTLEDDRLRIAVRDDGRGFAFKGQYDHAALVAANLGPASLRERADSLGGRMQIESTETGSRVEITLPSGVGAWVSSS